jgi:putative transposase
MNKVRQLALPLGMARPRRRSRSARTGVPHRTRPLHSHRHPLHVTLRRARRLPSMREESLFLALRRGLARTARSWFRVVQFSVQRDHVHLIVEALDKPSLSRGMTGLCVRLARAFNGALGRHGAVWGERYHARALRTPREVRNGLVYVLMNHRKHAVASHAAKQGFDVCSSAWWFRGWDRPPSSGPPLSADLAPVMPAETWLARTGWQRYGLIRVDESPKAGRHPVDPRPSDR